MTGNTPLRWARVVCRLAFGVGPLLRACGALALLLVALGLADCGKKGSPQPPPGVPNVYPRSYPRE